ncbi:hypothetical protein CBL_09325 [Carabus blaptoides fortunei]
MVIISISPLVRKQLSSNRTLSSNQWPCPEVIHAGISNKPAESCRSWSPRPEVWKACYIPSDPIEETAVGPHHHLLSSVHHSSLALNKGVNVVVLCLVIESVIQCSEKFYDTVKVCIRDIYDLIQIAMPPSMTVVSFNRY